MTLTSILLLILSIAVAAGLSFYQYLYKTKRTKTLLILFFLRFFSLFLVLLLLINPIFSKKTLETSLTPLAILVDNSQSITELKQNQNAQKVVNDLKNNSALQKKYSIQVFGFDNQFFTDSSFTFNGKQTNISLAAQNLKQLYRNQNYPVVLLTDGNQTNGNDYVYSFPDKTQVFPIVLGEKKPFLDFKIAQVNANKYAFLKNKFPVEIFIQSNVENTSLAQLEIYKGFTLINKQNITFSNAQKAQTIEILLTADKVGLQTYKAVLKTNLPEKNTYNNIKNFAVEVIDQRSEIGIVSSINHPDLGALKRAIETNAQRKVTLIKPNEISLIGNLNAVILYQPNSQFKSIIETIKNKNLNTFIISGNNTDFNFLNQNQPDINYQMSFQREDFTASFNTQFNTFALDNIGFELFPPLEHPFGQITTSSNCVTVLQATIRNIPTENPLLVLSENGTKRAAYLFGENIWKWRVESHVNSKSFEKFDVFIDKTIQYLVTNSIKKSLTVSHESFYNSGETIEISAQYFNKNYEFDENAQITAEFKNNKTRKVTFFDFVKGNNEYKLSLENLNAGNYSFLVKEINSNKTYSGKFEILDFNVEKQFINPDLEKLKQLAQQTNGKTYFANEIENLIAELLKKETFQAIQKENIKKSPLIDWVWGLILLTILLATEWFYRKYNGMI